MLFGNTPKKPQLDYCSSEDNDQDFCNRVDLLNSDGDSQSKKPKTAITMAERQKMREKLQKRRKQLEAQKAHL